mgnify:CR=1 FL=1
MNRKLAFIATTMLLTFSGLANSQNEQYAQGLIMDLYIVETEDDAKKPKGRSVATMVDPTPNTISYLEPVEIAPALKQFRDKPWGLHSQGFLEVETAGPHSFNVLMSSINNFTCATWIKIQDRVVTGHGMRNRYNGKFNQYGDVTLRPGIYAFEAWLGCTDVDRPSKLNLTINMRGPDDAMLKPVPENQLLHKL